MRHLIKRSAILIVATGCVVGVATTFDWHTVGKALAHMHVWQFIAMSVPLLLAIFALRGLRWLIVLGLRPDRVRFMQSFCANGVAAGLAVFTPFQLGEIMKIKLIPKSENRPWSFGLSAFLCERVMDLG
ncbi:MAG TPA: lysylphosphatidylglycerol synthase domain-containing protein, partial [Rhodanobacter sp.]